MVSANRTESEESMTEQDFLLLGKSIFHLDNLLAEEKESTSAMADANRVMMQVFVQSDRHTFIDRLADAMVDLSESRRHAVRALFKTHLIVMNEQ